MDPPEDVDGDRCLVSVTPGEDCELEDEEEEGEVDEPVVLHRVRKYDTLAGVALAHDVSVCVLRAMNNLMSDSIYEGQTLRVPAKSSSPTVGNTGGPKAISDPCLTATDKSVEHEIIEHVVKKTDTISSVALRYGMRTSELKELNDLATNQLKMGTVLKVHLKPLPSGGVEVSARDRRKSLSSSGEKRATKETKRKTRVSSNPSPDDPLWSTDSGGEKREKGDEKRGRGEDEKGKEEDNKGKRKTGANATMSPSRAKSGGGQASVNSPSSLAGNSGDTPTKRKGIFSVFSNGISPKKKETPQKSKSPAGPKPPQGLRLQSLRIGTVPHVACPGETIESIADVYGMRVDVLRQLNELVTDQLYPGQLLYVKTGNVHSQSPYQARRKRSLSTSIASDAAGVGRRREEGLLEYTVTATDTVSGIALAHNMTVARLKAVNGMSSEAKIYRGLKLLVDQPRPSMCSPPRTGAANLLAISKTANFLSPIPSQAPAKKETPRTALNRSLRNRSLHESFLSVPTDMMIPESLVHNFPCRLLVKNAPEGIQGTCTMTPHRVIFEPSPTDEFVERHGSMACQLELEIGEVTAPLMLTKDELATILGGTEIDVSSVKGSSILQLSRLSDANDDLSDISATYNLLVDKEHGEVSYRNLLDYLCNYSMLLAKERDRMAKLEAAAHLVVPVLRNKSSLFKADASLALIASYLPHRLQHCSWALAFASDKHGISLSTFYQRLGDEQYSLLFVEDHNGQVFGGFASAPWEVQEGYFGSGESFVFQYSPTAAVYPWQAHQSTKNHFLRAHRTHIEFGGGSRPSLWLGEDFNDGATGMSETFRNPPLSSSTDFKCTAVEVWVLRPPL